MTRLYRLAASDAPAEWGSFWIERGDRSRLQDVAQLEAGDRIEDVSALERFEIEAALNAIGTMEIESLRQAGEREASDTPLGDRILRRLKEKFPAEDATEWVHLLDDGGVVAAAYVGSARLPVKEAPEAPPAQG